MGHSVRSTQVEVRGDGRGGGEGGGAPSDVFVRCERRSPPCTGYASLAGQSFRLASPASGLSKEGEDERVGRGVAEELGSSLQYWCKSAGACTALG